MNTMTGQIAVIGEVETVGQKGFKKRSLVIVEDPQAKYLNEVKFQLAGDKVSLTDGWSVGDWIELDYFVNGRKWHNPKTDKDVYFVELNVREIRKAGAEADAAAEAAGASIDSVADDDIPF